MRPAWTRDAAFFAAGLLATAAQVLLLRELIVDVAGDEAAVGIGLGAWFVGIATGAGLARRRPADRAGRDAALALSLLAVLPPLGIAAGRLLRSVLAPDPGELPGAGLALLLALLTLAPPGAAVGWGFAALASAASDARRAGRAIARLYVVESFGSLAGGLVVTLLAGTGLPPLRLAALVGTIGALLALLGWRDGRRRLAAACALSLAVLAAARPLDAWSEAVRFAATAPGVPLRAVADTPYQHLTIGGAEVRDLYASGQYAGSFPDPYAAESLGNLVALMAPHPRRVLLLGGIEHGLLPVLLRHPVAQLTLVETDPAELAFLEPQLGEIDRSALRDRRVVRVAGDPRVVLSRTGEPFDLVVLLGPDPATLLRARLATVEFFRLVASRLGPDGAFVTSLPSAPTVLTGETEALAAALIRSLREALPVLRVTLAPDAFAVAGWDPAAVTLDPALLAARWRSRGVASVSFDAAVLPVLLPPDRVAARQAALDATAARAPLSRDDRPISFLHALARRQQIAAGRSGRRFVSAALGLPPGVLVALAFLPSLLGGLRWLVTPAGGPRLALSASHAAAAAGAAGLGWSLVVLFSFQTHAGALYGQLGALVATFMLGLALGALLAPPALGCARVGTTEMPAAARALRLSLTAAVLFSLSLPLTLHGAANASRAGVLAALLAHGALLLAAGAVTGSVFPVAVEARLAAGDGAGEAAARIETADHAGATLAALLGAVLFVPLLGLARSSILLAAVLALALAAASWSERRSG